VHGEAAEDPAFRCAGTPSPVLGRDRLRLRPVSGRSGALVSADRIPLGQQPEALRRGGASAIQLVLRLDGQATAALLARSCAPVPCQPADAEPPASRSAATGRIPHLCR